MSQSSLELRFALEDVIMTARPKGGKWEVTLEVSRQYMTDFITGVIVDTGIFAKTGAIAERVFPETVSFEVTADQLAAITALAIGIGEEESSDLEVTRLYELAEAALPPSLHRDLRPIP